MRRKRAEQRGEEVISNIAKLRPGRKAMERKPPKRRPKSYKNQTKTPSREENEDDNNTSMDVDPSSPKTIPVTLPPGAKAPLDAVQTEGHTAGGPMDCQEHEMTDNSDDDDDCDHQKRHKKSGLTKPYKIKKDFIEHGIDGKTLVEGNLGLFNLSTLGRFMKCVTRFFAVRSSRADDCGLISTDCTNLVMISPQLLPPLRYLPTPFGC
jgi:hypothetical protein